MSAAPMGGHPTGWLASRCTHSAAGMTPVALVLVMQEVTAVRKAGVSRYGAAARGACALRAVAPLPAAAAPAGPVGPQTAGAAAPARHGLVPVAAAGPLAQAPDPTPA